jgi:hypothetical protein
MLCSSVEGQVARRGYRQGSAPHRTAAIAAICAARQPGDAYDACVHGAHATLIDAALDAFPGEAALELCLAQRLLPYRQPHTHCSVPSLTPVSVGEGREAW